MKKSKIYAMLLATTLIAACIIGTVQKTEASNKQYFDFNYTFNYAEISLPSGECKCGEVDKWTDYDDSDMVQVIFKDGNVYYTHGSNVVLVYKKG